MKFILKLVVGTVVVILTTIATFAVLGVLAGAAVIDEQITDLENQQNSPQFTYNP